MCGLLLPCSYPYIVILYKNNVWKAGYKQLPSYKNHNLYSSLKELFEYDYNYQNIHYKEEY